MSRWRPPAPRSTAIITSAGLRALQRELDELWRVKRPQVVKALAAAAAEGDRSENAEYQYRKKELAGIDRRVRYLGKRIPDLQVAPAAPPRRDRVYFGARVRVRDLVEQSLHEWRIVGPDETDNTGRAISIDAPMARSLLGHAVGDEVETRLPGGTRQLRIEALHYPDAED